MANCLGDWLAHGEKRCAANTGAPFNLPPTSAGKVLGYGKHCFIADMSKRIPKRAVPAQERDAAVINVAV